MEGDIIQRAFEVAPQCGTVEEVRHRLACESYMNVNVHLSGKLPKQQIKERLNPELKLRARLPAAARNRDRSYGS